MSPLVLLLFAMVAGVGAAVASGLVRFGGRVEDRYAAKLSAIEDHALTLEEIELAQPFSQRFLVPMRDRLAALVSARTPASRQEEIKNLIATAGHPYGLTVNGILAAKVISALVFGLLGAGVMLGLLRLGFPAFLLVAAPPVLGWILPDRWLKQQADGRRRGIENAMPDTIDLLTICLDAGLSFDAALQRVAEKVEGPLREELGSLLSEIRYGVPRMDAMEAMAARLQVDDMSAFINAVVQSQKLGVALGETVRIQAQEIRRRRRQAAEEKAGQASLKMLFPMIGCIFPTLFIALMGPVVIIIVTRH